MLDELTALHAGIDWHRGLFTTAPLTAKQHTDCLHRGDLLETIGCETCAGNVRVKVFACSLHGRCQLSSKLTGVSVCDG